MKNFYLTFVLLFGFYYAQSQIVDIPDVNFKFALINFNVADLGNGFREDVDANNDNEIQVSEAEAVLGLFMIEQFIVTTEGLESFINIEILDVNQNYSLIDLEVFNNQKLKELYCSSNQLSSLNVTQNPLLEKLHCSANVLTSLDISQNPNLIELYVGINELTSLDVSQNQNLTNLWCSNNPINNLDVTQNINLEKLNCENNQLTELNVTQNSNLRWLNCGNNLLESIDVSQNKFLELFFSNFNFYSSLSFTQNPILEKVHCRGNQITSIDISQNFALTALLCSQNMLTTLEVSFNSNLKTIYCYSNLLTSLDVSHNLNLIKLICEDNMLETLDIKNGNNHNIWQFNAINNPNLLCIQVDNEVYANSRICEFYGSDWCKDDWAEYSEDCTLGLEDNNLQEFAIYPNPTQNILNIETQGEIIESLKIINLQGIIVKEVETTNRIDVSSLASGLYFIQIYSEGNRITKKFIKK